MLRNSYPTFFYVNLNKFQETQKNICVRDKNKNIYIDTWTKNDKQNNKTSNSSISLVYEDMLRTSSSWKPKKVRHKGGISSWCKRFRKSQMSTSIGNDIYVQDATQLEHGGQYLLVPEGMSIMDVSGVNLICTECMGTCASNYHVVTTTTVPHIVTWKHEQHRPDYSKPG